MMRIRAKHVPEGQARERKKEGKPACLGAHVEKTRFRRTGLVESEGQWADLAIPPRGTQHTKLGKLRVSQDKSS